MRPTCGQSPPGVGAESAVVARPADVQVRERGHGGAAVPEAEQVDIDQAQVAAGGEVAEFNLLGEDGDLIVIEQREEWDMAELVRWAGHRR